MFRIATFALFTTLCTLSGLTAQPAPPPAKPAKPPEKAAGDKLVESAVAKLKGLTWMKVSLRHEVYSPGMNFEAKGRCVLAPGRKVRYELEINNAGAKGMFRQVSDGQTLWRLQRLGDEKQIASFTLPQYDESLQKIGQDETGRQVREELEAEYGFSGVRPLLEDVQKRIAFTRVEETTLTRPGRAAVAVHRLEGEWNKAAREQIIPARKTGSQDAAELWDKRLDFFFQPRKCRLYLLRGPEGPATPALLPVRLEWHGPVQRAGGDELLAAIDFDDFVITPPAKPEDWAAEFQFPLDDADKKGVRQIQPSAFAEAKQKQLEQRKEQEQRTRTLRPLDPGQ